jgi:hypothetical protein
MPTRVPLFDPAQGDRRPATLRSMRGDLPLRAVTVRVSMIGKDLAPSSLRIAFDGRPVWTSLGVAPSVDFLAPRRSLVPLVAAVGLRLDRSPRPPAEPLVGRSVVVPRSTVAATPAIAPPSPPRPRRLRWWF